MPTDSETGSQPRPRCLNCDARFEKHKPWQKFCSDACRSEFNTYGGAYRRLKRHIDQQLPGLVRQSVEGELRALDEMRRANAAERVELLRIAARVEKAAAAAERHNSPPVGTAGGGR